MAFEGLYPQYVDPRVRPTPPFVQSDDELDMGYGEALKAAQQPPAGKAPAPPAQPVSQPGPAQPQQAPAGPPEDLASGYLPPGPAAAAGSPTAHAAGDLGGLAPAGIQHGPSPLENVQRKGEAVSSLGARPATNADVPRAQQHHGFRKALDIMGAVGLGAAAFNPGVGLRYYDYFSGAPLRHAQASYDARLGAAQGEFKRAQEEEQSNIGEERVAGLDAQRKAVEERAKAYQDKTEQSFVAGSEREDPKSPTGYIAQTVSGEWKPFTPKPQKNTKSDDISESSQAWTKIADALGLKGEARQHYIATGKFKEPGTNIHVPSAESERLNEWHKAFVRDNKREPNAEEWRTQKFDPNAHQPQPKDHNLPKEKSDIEGKKTQEILAEEQRFKKEWDAAYKANDSPDQKTLEGLKTEHESRKGVIQSSYEQRMKTIDRGQNNENQPQHKQPVAAVTQKSKQQVKVNDSVTWSDAQGKQHHGTVTGFKPNGKPQVREQ